MIYRSSAFICMVAITAIGCGKRSESESETETLATHQKPDKRLEHEQKQPPRVKVSEGRPKPPTTPETKPLTEEEKVAKFLETYLATPFAERGKFVADPKEYETARAAYYKGVPTPRDAKVVVTELSKGPRPSQLTVTATVTMSPTTALSPKSSSVEWPLRVTGEGFKIDWSALVGYNSLGHKAWAAGTEETRTARVEAKLSDYYNYHYDQAKETHYSIRCEETFGDRYDSFTGYVPKASALGKKLFQLVKDGQDHRVILTFERTGRETSVVEIIALVSESWVRP